MTKQNSADSSTDEPQKKDKENLEACCNGLDRHTWTSFLFEVVAHAQYMILNHHITGTVLILVLKQGVTCNLASVPANDQRKSDRITLPTRTSVVAEWTKNSCSWAKLWFV